MITLLGIGHVFQLRDTVQGVITGKLPGLVCIELDEVRYKVLRSKQRGGTPPSFAYYMLARFEEKLADMYGSSVGDEMLAAVDAARDLKIPVAFIDMDGQMMFRRMMKEMTIKERVWFFLASLGSVFVSKKRVEKELKEFEENTEAYMAELEKRFPAIKRVLIDERDEHMAGKLAAFNTKIPDIVAVVGDGHVLGISSRLAYLDLEHEVIRLSELRPMEARNKVLQETGQDDEDGPEDASIGAEDPEDTSWSHSFEIASVPRDPPT
jgi:pheromone shutdown protein TraB